MTQLAMLAAVTVETAAAMFSNSVVQVDYTLRKSSAARNREVSLNCWCPVCNSTHRRTAGDSERGVPATMPGFVLSPTEILVQDPGVRAANLGGIALRIGGERVAAKEVSRIRRPRAVVLEAEKPIPGVRPIEFFVGAVSNWFYIAEHEGLRQAGIKKYSKDEGKRFYPDLRLTMRKAPPCCLGLAADGRPVTVSLMRDFDSAAAVTNPPCQWKREGADTFEKEASAHEDAIRAAALPVVINLDPPKRESEGMRYRFISDYDDESKKKEFDAVGYVMDGGLVMVPSALTGEQIGRIARIEAKLPDGKTVRLKFEGAYADWNALALRFDGQEPAGIGRLSVAPVAPTRPFDTTAWQVVVVNENGRICAEARRGVLNGMRVARDGAQMPSFAADCAVTDHGEKAMEVLMTEDGQILSMRLSRRYSTSRWRSDDENVPCGLLSRLLSERPYNPEFAPRVEDDRNRLVWLGVESVELTTALAREKKAQSEMENYSRPPLVTEVYPGSPADKAGIRVDDILISVRREGMAEQPLRADRSRGNFDARWFFESPYGGGEPPWPNVENSVNKLLTQHGVGAKLTLVYSRGGERREAEIVLEAAPVHYKNAKRARNRTLGLSVADLTFEVRRFFKFADDAPGVVIAKVKPGSPAQVAGLRPCELVTEVNGAPVKGARDFAAKVKDVRDLTLSVRRLAETRVVRIRVNPEAKK